MQNLLKVIFTIASSLTIGFSQAQSCTISDLKSFKDSLSSAKASYQDRNKWSASYGTYYNALLCSQSMLAKTTGKTERDELMKLIGDSWYTMAVITGNSGIADATIYNMSFASSYGNQEASAQVKIFLQTFLHNKKNINITPASGQCTSGDCTDGWGKYEWSNGCTYEGEWMNGVMSGQGTYMSKSGESWYSTKWWFGLPAVDQTEDVPNFPGYPNYGNVKFGLRGLSGLAHYGSGDATVQYSGDTLIADNAKTGGRSNDQTAAGSSVYSDFELEATMNISGGPTNQYNGITFRGWNDKYYVFAMTSLGSAIFYNYTSNSWINLKEAAGTQSPANTNGRNSLKVRAQGGTLEMFVNNVSVGKFTDQVRMRGAIGIYLSANNIVKYTGFKIRPL